jgi:hypothetical protein
MPTQKRTQRPVVAYWRTVAEWRHHARRNQRYAAVLFKRADAKAIFASALGAANAMTTQPTRLRQDFGVAIEISQATRLPIQLPDFFKAD